MAIREYYNIIESIDTNGRQPTTIGTYIFNTTVLQTRTQTQMDEWMLDQMYSQSYIKNARTVIVNHRTKTSIAGGTAKHVISNIVSNV